MVVHWLSEVVVLLQKAFLGCGGLKLLCTLGGMAGSGPQMAGEEVVVQVQSTVFHPREPHAMKHPVHDAHRMKGSKPIDPWGKWDCSRLGLGTAQCHQNSSPAFSALQLQTRWEQLVPGAGKMLRSLDPALLFPQQPASSSPALVAAASLGAS